MNVRRSDCGGNTVTLTNSAMSASQSADIQMPLWGQTTLALWAAPYWSHDMVQRSCDLKIGLWQRAFRKVTKALNSKVLTGAGIASHFSLKQLCRTSVPSRRRQHPRRPHHPHHHHHHHHHHHRYIPLNTPLRISQFFTPLSPCLPPFPYTFPAFVPTPSPQVVAQESSQLISQGQLRFLPGQGQGHPGRGETGRGRRHSDCVMLGGNSGRWLGDRKWIMTVMA